MRKIFALFLTIALLICAAATAEGAFTVGVCQLVQHPALDKATEGFCDALNELLGDEVTLDVQNASGDSATCITIVNSLLAENCDLIMANATPALQAAVAATGDIPILGTSISVYPVALDLPDMGDSTGINVSGTSDLSPLDQQAQMILELFPDAKEIGLVYCSAEANSIFQCEQISKFLTEAGLNCTEFTFADSNDVSSVVTNACAASDVIYIPTDNTAASCAEAIRNVVEPAGIPVFAGEENLCAGCGVAALTIDYYVIGFETGKMAAEILKDGADISTMSIRYAPEFKKVFNAELCEIYGLSVPDDYAPIEG